MPNGLELVTPSTVDKTGSGSTATINTNGSVSFSACESLSLNGVFTSTYENYMIVCHVTQSGGTGVQELTIRLRASGADSTNTTDYNHQYLTVTGTTEQAALSRVLGYWTVGRAYTSSSSAATSGFVTYVYGPQLAEPTAGRSIAATTNNGVEFYEFAMNHELSTSYDGFTLRIANVILPTTGRIAVYGMVS